MYASNFFETKICGLPRGTSVSAPAALYLALYLTNPNDDNSGQEVTYTGYARQAISFTAPAASGSGMMIQNTAAINFPEASSAVGNVQYVGVLDALTGGNLWLYAPLSAPLPIVAGTTPIIRANAARWTLTGAVSTYYKTAILNLLRGQTVSGFTGYLALFDGDPQSTGNELGGEDYARVSIAFDAPESITSGATQVKNSAEVLTPIAGENWGTLRYTALMDASENGNVFLSRQLESPYNMTAGSAAGYHRGDLKFNVN